MKRNLMVMLSLSVMLAFVAQGNLNAQAGKTSFAGSWAFNAEKSDQPQQGGGGGGRGMFGGDFIAKQDGNLLQVERTRTNPQSGETTTTTTKYTLDGKESVNTSARGESKSVATWSADGKSLTINTALSFTGQDGTVRETKLKEVWTITGTELTIVSTSPTQDGERVVKRVYTKK